MNAVFPRIMPRCSFIKLHDLAVAQLALEKILIILDEPSS